MSPRQPGAVELTDKRVKHGKHFLNPDRTYTAEFVTGAIHYQTTASGAWIDKQQAFRAGSGTAEWISDASDVQMRTFQVGTGGNARWWVEFKETLTGRGVQFQLQFQPTVVAGDNKLTFSDGAGGTWTYYHTAAGGKMLGPPTAASKGPQSFSMAFALIGGADPLVVNADGSISCGTLFTMPRAVLKGSDNADYPASAWAISGSTLTFTYDDTALPAAAYPYRVDPQTTFAITAGGNDVRVQATASSVWPPNTTPTETTGGTVIWWTRKFATTYEDGLGLYQLDTSSLGAAATVTGATFRYNQSTVSSAPDSLAILGDWFNWTGVATNDYTHLIATANAYVGGSAYPTAAAIYDLTLLNASTNVSTAGTTKLRFGLTQRAADAAPTGDNSLNHDTFESAGTTKPTLIVDYTLPGPSYRSSASGTGTGATVSPTLPTGWAIGDIVGIAVAFQGGSGVTINTPTGWTLDPTAGRVDSTTNISQAVFYRSMQSGDAAPSFTLGSSQKYVWESAAYQPGSGGNPTFDKMSGQSNVSSTTVSAPTLTPSSNNALVVFWGATNTGTTFTTPPTGYTERLDVQSGGGQGGSAATKTYYFLDAAATSGGDLMNMQDGGTAPTTATTATGWTVGTNTAPNYADMDRAAMVARTASDATYGWKTTAPTSPVDSTRGNASRTPAALSGSFASANWTYSWVPRLSSANTVQRGSLRVRLFRGTSATGSGATEITAGAAEAGPMTAAASSTSTAAYTVAVNPGALTLVNEYLFFVLDFRITTAGGATTSNIILAVGSGFSIVTSTFTPDLDLTVENADLAQTTAAATGTVSATAGAAAVNVGQLMSLTPPVSVPAAPDVYQTFQPLAYY